LGLIAGSAVTNANLTGAVTSVGNATSLGSFTSAQLATALTDETGSGANVFATSPTLVTPALGTPSAAVLTNATGLPLTTGVTGTLPILNGGTGQTTANAAFNALVPSQTGNSGKYLTTDGTDTSWGTNPLGTVTSVGQSFTGGLISVAGSPITTSGTLALTVAGTSGGIPYFSSATTWATSAALAANALVVGGGAGATPATVTTGTGVVTALGVNTGTAGAFVVNGGALGTPSSGTVTNLTGTASININGTVGATTATTGAFTTVTASTPIGTASGGTGLGGATPFTSGGVVYASSTSALATGSALTYDGTTFKLTGSDNNNLIRSQNSNGTASIRIQSNAAGNYLVAAGPDPLYFQNGSATGVMVFAPASSSEGMRLTSTGLGIGTTSPASKLHVANTYTNTSDATIVASAGIPGINLRSTSSGRLSIFTNYSAANATSFLVGTGTNNPSTEAIQIDHSTGTTRFRTTIGVGEATPSSSGIGITFPATQSASTDANTLDDYEEGTWTPSVGGTSTYTQQQGSYIKVGRLVTVSFDMAILLLGTGSTSSMSGLPFTVGSATSPKYEQCHGAMGYVQSLAVNVYSLTFNAAANGTAIVSVSMNTLGGTANVNPAIYGNGTRVQGTVTYMAVN
jgi:hypothetical protein